MLVNTAGDYFAVASVQMYTGEELGAPAKMRYDMANAFRKEQRLITYQEPADILAVPNNVLIVSYDCYWIGDACNFLFAGGDHQEQESSSVEFDARLFLDCVFNGSAGHGRFKLPV
jgi:hypothetical protein